MAKILAIDYGKKRIGLAISDPDKIIATRLPLIQVKDKADALKKLNEVILQNDISIILFGFPLNAEGNETPMSEEVKNIAEEIKKNFSGEIVFRNEFYSSVYTQHMTQNHKFTRKHFDSEVARRLLQEHLDELTTND